MGARQHFGTDVAAFRYLSRRGLVPERLLQAEGGEAPVGPCQDGHTVFLVDREMPLEKNRVRESKALM